MGESFQRREVKGSSYVSIFVCLQKILNKKAQHKNSNDEEGSLSLGLPYLQRLYERFIRAGNFSTPALGESLSELYFPYEMENSLNGMGWGLLNSSQPGLLISNAGLREVDKEVPLFCSSNTSGVTVSLATNLC